MECVPQRFELAEEVTARAFEKGLLIYPSTGCANGVDGDLIALAPPFIIEEPQIDRIVSLLLETLTEMSP